MAEIYRVWSALLGWLEGRERVHRHVALGFVAIRSGCHTRLDLVPIVAYQATLRRAEMDSSVERWNDTPKELPSLNSVLPHPIPPLSTPPSSAA